MALNVMFSCSNTDLGAPLGSWSEGKKSVQFVGSYDGKAKAFEFCAYEITGNRELAWFGKNAVQPIEVFGVREQEIVDQSLKLAIGKQTLKEKMQVFIVPAVIGSDSYAVIKSGTSQFDQLDESLVRFSLQVIARAEPGVSKCLNSKEQIALARKQAKSFPDAERHLLAFVKKHSGD